VGLILDTSFVIQAEREARRGLSDRTEAFLIRNAAEHLFITFTVAGELACGQSANVRRDWERLCQPYPILPWTMEISWQYGEIFRALSAAGKLIGGNDLWIAATALVHGYGVVTANEEEFRRVPGLMVEAF
jgi:tRNA(fMet)-specific endonuclease VapC